MAYGQGRPKAIFQEKAVLYYWQGAIPIALFQKEVQSMGKDSPNIFPIGSKGLENICKILKFFLR
jgi:hypothetical protein